MLNRLAIITIGMLKDINESIKKENLKIISEAKISEMTANKISLFCKRILNTIGHKDKIITAVYNIVKYLEEITDECNYISSYMTKEKINKVDKNIINYIEGKIRQIELWDEIFNEYKTNYIIEKSNDNKGRINNTLEKFWHYKRPKVAKGFPRNK